MKIRNLRYKIIFILLAIAFTSSLILSIIPIPLICSPTEGCYTVQNSPYARTFNIKNDYFGDVIFIFMLILTISYLTRPSKKKDFIIRMGTFFGALVAIYFIYLQIFVIKAFCKYCMVVDTSTILAFIVSMIPFGRKHKTPGEEEKFEVRIEE